MTEARSSTRTSSSRGPVTAEGEDKSWINRRGTIYWYDQKALNEQETAFRRYDPDRIVSELLGTGADIIAVYATNQYGVAYYPSDIWPQHPNLEGRDYVGELTQALQAHGKKVILYINWHDSKHPEWSYEPIGESVTPVETRYRLASWAHPDQPNGQVWALPGGQLHRQRPCFNSPKREQVLAIAREILGRYRPEGFHLDMFFHTAVCVCRYCRPELERICGTTDITMEAVHANWREYIDWRSERTGSFLQELSAVVREHGAIAAHNALAPVYLPSTWGLNEEWLPALDVFLSECFDAFNVGYLDLNSASVNVRWQHAIRKPSWILRTSTPLHYDHWPLTEAQWQIAAAACKANGSKVFGPCGEGARPDTTTSPSLLENVTRGLEFYMQDSDLDEGARSVATVALLFSWATRRYDRPTPMATPSAEELIGWSRLLIEEHVPFDIVDADSLSDPSQLEGYELLVLPGLTRLNDGSCETIRRYVRGGGRVIATSDTSLANESDETRDDFALGDVLGVSWRGYGDGHFAISVAGDAEPASGRLQHVTTTGEQLAMVVSVDPAGSVMGVKDPMPLEATSWPAETRHVFGEGCAVYSAFGIGRYFNQHGDAHIGRRMAALLDATGGERQLVMEAPRTVEVTVWRQPVPERTIVHLANRTVPWTLPTNNRQISEIVPVHDLKISLDSPYDEPRVSARGATVEAHLREGRLELSVARVDAYAALVIEPASSDAR